MIEVINRTKSRLSKKLVIQVLTAAAKLLKIKAMDLSVVFVNQTEIKKLNHKYRKKNKPTDVLSFCYHYKNNQLDGEIIICHTLNKETPRLLVHSLLHLTGHGHQKKLEDKIIKKI